MSSLLVFACGWLLINSPCFFFPPSACCNLIQGISEFFSGKFLHQKCVDSTSFDCCSQCGCPSWRLSHCCLSTTCQVAPLKTVLEIQHWFLKCLSARTHSVLLPSFKQFCSFTVFCFPWSPSQSCWFLPLSALSFPPQQTFDFKSHSRVLDIIADCGSSVVDYMFLEFLKPASLFSSSLSSLSSVGAQWIFFELNSFWG